MTKLSDMKPDQIELLEEVGREIVEALRSIPLEVEGTPNVTQMFPDGTYKVKPVDPMLSFFMEQCYLGKKGEIIFQLSPEDAQPYKFVELSYKAMDKVFPLAGSELAKASNTEGEDFRDIFNWLTLKKGEEIMIAEEKAQQEYAENPRYGMF